jgi:hypothetical protein
MDEAGQLSEGQPSMTILMVDGCLEHLETIHPIAEAS